MNDFSLYWWRPGGNGQSNLGDEISPIVLSHVSGRRIIRAGLDDCEGIAIGSVFYPRKASARKRSKPLFVWGSGTLKPRHCSYQGLSVILAALRGPGRHHRSKTVPMFLSAIRGCSCVRSGPSKSLRRAASGSFRTMACAGILRPLAWVRHWKMR